jgi:hypothetical protein
MTASTARIALTRLPTVNALCRSLLSSTAIDAVAIGAGMIDLARQGVRAAPAEAVNDETSP